MREGGKGRLGPHLSKILSVDRQDYVCEGPLAY